MKKYGLSFILLFSTLIPGYSQNEENAFDFWLGNWDISWSDAKGNEFQASNKVVKILDGKVIEENFEDSGSGLKGKSLSVYNPRTQTWHQAWADNQGGYYDFVGEIDGDTRIFKTRMVEKDGNKIIQRMRFYDIKENSLMWDWERSMDNGKTWTLLWRLHYTRSR